MYRMSLFLILCITSFSHDIWSQESQNIDRAFEMVKLTNNTIVSGKGSYIYTYRLVSDSKLNELEPNNELDKTVNTVNTYEKAKYVYTFDNNSFFFEHYDDISGDKIKECSFDGNTFRQITYSYHNELVYPLGHISNALMIDSFHEHPLYITNTSIDNYIAQYQSNKDLVLNIDQETRDNMKYLAITFDRDEAQVKYYIDEANYYRTSKILYETKDDVPSLYEEVTVSYQNIDGIAFPKRINIKYFDKGELLVEKNLLFNDDWKLNITIDNSVFEISFPMGMTVIDNIVGNTFVVE